ncbi:MAG: hypothetical protein ACR2MD_01020 [Aridibacter sp.]
MPGAMENAFNQIAEAFGRTISPNVFPDTCRITSNTPTVRGGSEIKGAATDIYTDVPCLYEPDRSGYRGEAGGRILSTNQYKVTIPAQKADGTRINFDVRNHEIIVNERGLEPTKKFLPVSAGDKQGVLFEVICQRES